MNFPADFDFDQLRKIDYKFNAGFLDLQQVGTKYALFFRLLPRFCYNFHHFCIDHFHICQHITSACLTYPFLRRLVFKVGDKPVRNFRMIERHYHKDKLLKSYDFNFKFCIPNTTNEWEAMYDLPKMDDDLSTLSLRRFMF